MNDKSGSNVPAISVHEMNFTYPHESHAVRNLSLAIERGEKLGVIGPNGAGKSTFFHLCCGLLQPDSGKIQIMGRDVLKGEFNSSVGLVFQNPDVQLICPTVFEDIAFGPENVGVSPGETDDLVKRIMELTGIGHVSHRPPHNLSAGEKRMVAIAGVLALQPKVVFYDEPEASLDIRSRRKVIEFLKSTDEVLLIASHDLELILEVCTRTIILDSGNLCADGIPEALLSDEELMQAHGMEKPHSLIPHSRPHNHRL